MGQDFIPTNDDTLEKFAKTLLDYATANLAGLGLVAADLTPMANALADFTTKNADAKAARNAAKASVAARDDSRDVLEPMLRAFNRQMQGTASVKDAQKSSMGLPVAAKGKSPVPAPTSRPVVSVDTSQRLRHILDWVDELSPGSRKRPANVAGAEIYHKVGTAPTGPDDMDYIVLDTHTPYLTEYDAEVAGQLAYYALRWVNARGERGPWSQIVSATITA